MNLALCTAYRAAMHVYIYEYMYGYIHIYIISIYMHILRISAYITYIGISVYIYAYIHTSMLWFPFVYTLAVFRVRRHTTVFHMSLAILQSADQCP